MGAADADQELVTASLRMRFVGARVREEGFLDLSSPGAQTTTPSAPHVLSISLDEQPIVRAQLCERLELTLIQAARNKLAKSNVDPVVLQSIFVKSEVHLIRKMALGYEVAVASLPEAYGVFATSRPHLRDVGKNLALTLLSACTGQVPAHAADKRLSAGEVNLLQTYQWAEYEDVHGFENLH